MLPSNSNQSEDFRQKLGSLRPGMAFVVMIFGALIAFEVFNYSTTDHALGDVLGGLTFAGIPWSTILALAFCGIDFAGIARLFTPEQGMDEPKEVWYLFGAWLLAATMNAILTWWGVSLAVASNPVKSSAVVDPETLTSVVPVFVAIMVWVIRILIIGTLSLALDRMLHPGTEQRTPFQTAIGNRQPHVSRQPIQQPMHIPQNLGSASIPPRPLPRAAAPTNSSRPARFSAPNEEPDGLFDNNQTAARGTEPTYHNIAGRPNTTNVNTSNGNGRFRSS